jgi:hypothetical protein
MPRIIVKQRFKVNDKKPESWGEALPDGIRWGRADSLGNKKLLIKSSGSDN